MRLLIEVEDEQERTVLTDKIDKVKEIFNSKVEIIYADRRSDNVFDKVDKLKWNMGRKFYKDRESLYER